MHDTAAVATAQRLSHEQSMPQCGDWLLEACSTCFWLCARFRPSSGVAGAVRRVRGVAHSMRVSPQSSNRMVDGARSVLNDFLADVYIFTDHMTGLEAGQSPGYGLMLVAETTTGCFISSECTANTRLKVRQRIAAACNSNDNVFKIRQA